MAVEGIAVRVLCTLILVVLGLGMAPLLDGVSRKIKARLQYRYGPPVLQTFYDIAKLLGIESVAPVKSMLFVAAPYVAFASALASVTVLPLGTFQPLSFTGDVFVWLYVLAMVSVSMMLAGFVAPNAYANIGANREMMLILSIEPVLGLGIGILALLTRSLTIVGIARGIATLPPYALILALVAYVLLAYAIYVEGGFVPFDVAEAETEILEGSLCEYSGRLLALFKLALLIKRFALVWFYASLVAIPVATSVANSTILQLFVAIVLQLAVTFAMYSGIAVSEALSARYRIDQVISLNTKIFFASLAMFVVTAVSSLG